MAASANLSGNQPEQSSFNGPAAPSSLCNGNSGAVPDFSATAALMRHNPGIAITWSAEEQQILEDGLIQFASEVTVVRYAKIAQNLPNKTVRDVALRCRWMNKKEISKRRKEDHMRKSKDKRVSDHSTKIYHLSNNPVNQPYAMPLTASLDGDGISYKAIGGLTGELLEQNALAFQQISANFTSYQTKQCLSHTSILVPSLFKYTIPQLLQKYSEIMIRASFLLPSSLLHSSLSVIWPHIHGSKTVEFPAAVSLHSVLAAGLLLFCILFPQIQDNIDRFCQARENIIKIMNSLNETPEIMKQMPPLPVKLNEELINSFIPR